MMKPKEKAPLYVQLIAAIVTMKPKEKKPLFFKFSKCEFLNFGSIFKVKIWKNRSLGNSLYQTLLFDDI